MIFLQPTMCTVSSMRLSRLRNLNLHTGLCWMPWPRLMLWQCSAFWSNFAPHKEPRGSICMIRLGCEAFVGGETNWVGGAAGSQTMSLWCRILLPVRPSLQYVAANCPASVWSEFSHPTLLTGKLTQALYILTVAIICFESPRCKYHYNPLLLLSQLPKGAG